jgi:hypothetical protein
MGWKFSDQGNSEIIMSILTEIKKSQAKGFRRIYMRRRVGNDYEATWTQIPSKYIKSFGEIEYGLEDIKVNFFKFSGFDFTVDNIDGYFSDTDESQSYFYGATCIPLTMVKVEAGYEASDGTEYPTNTVMFVGLLDGDIEYNQDNTIGFKASHLSEVFDKVTVDLIPSLSGNYTASDLFIKIRDFTDSNSVYFFQKYISSGAWSIETTTSNYIMPTNTTIDDMTCWELMQKLAEAENKVMYVSRDGGFYFQSKGAVSSTAAFHFSGLGDGNKTYGHTIMKNISLNKMFSKIYNRIKIKFDDEDTTTSYYTKSESWAWGDSTSSWLYGVNTYDLENVYLNASTSAIVATEIYNEYVNPKNEIEFESKFIPQLNLNDYVTLTYKTKRYANNSSLWGTAIWGKFFWSDFTGYNININNGDFRIIQAKHDLDKFNTTFRLRQL